MWTKGEEPPPPPPLDLDESIEAPSTSSSVQITEKPPDNPIYLINYKQIILKNQVDLKKKEEEVQVIFIVIINFVNYLRYFIYLFIVILIIFRNMQKN